MSGPCIRPLAMSSEIQNVKHAECQTLEEMTSAKLFEPFIEENDKEKTLE